MSAHVLLNLLNELGKRDKNAYFKSHILNRTINKLYITLAAYVISNTML